MSGGAMDNLVRWRREHASDELAKVCEGCGCSYVATGLGRFQRKYCGPSCPARVRVDPVKVPALCEACGREYAPMKVTQKYCRLGCPAILVREAKARARHRRQVWPYMP